MINAHIDGEMSDLQQATYGRTLLGEITKNFNSKKRIFGMGMEDEMKKTGSDKGCPLYTSDAADEGLGVDLGGPRLNKKYYP